MIHQSLPVRTFVLCADDYAISEPVSAGILSLVERRRLSATSCLVTSRHWLRQAALLRVYAKEIDVGLHLNLIIDDLLEQDSAYHPALQSYPRHVRLILNSLMRRLDPGLIALEIERQLDRFLEGWGSPPDFIDGHLHVHQLPVVRDALLLVYKKRLTGSRCYVRSVGNIISGGGGRFKTAVISALGGRQLRTRLTADGIPHNSAFGGIYGFQPGSDYRKMMRTWLRGLGRSGMLMCHPALADPRGSDPIGECRWREYNYLSSDAFVGDCAEAGVTPGRFQAA